MSKICFLIAMHKNYNQIMRLINHLKTDFDLYIHIDKKSNLDIKSFDNVNIYKKYKVYHGGISQIIATLFLIKEAYKNNYDRYIFISGQDIPLKTNEEIINFFYKDENKNKEFINYQNVTNNKQLYEMTYMRLNHYHFNHIMKKLLHMNVRKILTQLLIKPKSIENMYFGSSWWNLTNDAIKYILDYIKNNPKYLKRFNNTWCCDEYFFQSILLNSKFKNDCINNYLRYMDWSRMVGMGPHTFLSDDYNLIKDNIKGNLFARKFDENIDNDIINKLYKDLEVK